ncbi:hypothetical protein EDD17DRAFT_1749693 [Pisolithus thermaeus]|nr:hypothetical protein EV401DRAFT_2082290 [Pisolithus croceorrhizus]KAI6169183.1 hypothetical protein EDD17DRAFT_1749693 [Pisolithus thermaeus]
MTALPPKLPSGLQDDADVTSAYCKCLELERIIQSEINSGNGVERQMIYCRIFGYLFHHFPARDITSFVQEVVNISFDREKLLDIGKCFYVYFVKLLKSYKGRPSTLSSHSSLESVDNLVDKITNELQEAPQNHHTAQIRALARDGFRCVVTKAYDMFAAEDNAKLRQTIEKEGASTAVTDCTYVFPLSPGSDSEEMYAASVWALLDCFGYHNLRQKLNGDNAVPHKYEIKASKSLHLIHRPKFVTFSAPDPDKYPLPNPTYLAIRAACAKVAHLSGVVEHIRSVLERLEDTRVLAEDGGSSELLYTAILSSMCSSYVTLP